MMNECAIDMRQGSWLNWLFQITDLNPKPNRVYDYSRATPGIDYVFDRLSEQDNRGYMTAQRRGVEVGDYVLLTQDGVTRKYRIQSLDYYSSPSYMWIALLTMVNK